MLHGSRNPVVIARFWPPLIGVFYFITAFLGVELTKTTDGIATVWPASGVLMAALLLAPIGWRKPVVGWVAVASFVANWLGGSSVVLSACYTLANLVEACGVLLIAKPTRRMMSFHEPVWVGKFSLGAIVGAAGGGATAYTLQALITGDFSGGFFLSWFATTALGLLIFTPLIVTAYRALDGSRSGRPTASPIEVVLIVAASGACATVAFFQTAVPVTFLPFIAVILATYRLGALGATGSITITAIVGSLSVPSGMGTVGVVLGDAVAAVWFLQLFLVCLLAAALPMAALLAAHWAEHEDTLREKRMQDMAEKSAKIGHWVYAPEEDDLYWSDETYRIHGLEPGAPRELEESVDVYHPDDRAKVSECVALAIERCEPFSFTARIRLPDGSYKRVESRGEVDADAHGETLAVYGIIQDISERLATMEALEEARAKAVAEAAHAKHLAQTDALTGVANRRKTIETLDLEIERYRRHGGNLSIALLDIDHFKSINDQYGHGIGDVVLKRITAVCVDIVRACDLVGRLGGEEFVVVFPDTSPDGTMVVSERIRLAIEALTFPEAPGLRVTTSIGVAGIQPEADANFLLQAADLALYEAKREGRNRMSLAA